jgi:uncharacterized protein
LSLVLDTSFVLALLDEDDRNHDRTASTADDTREDFVVPLLTLTEIDYFLRKAGRGEVWHEFVREIESGGYRLHAPDERQLVRAAELEREYSDLRLGVVDASVIVACEELGETKVATLDRRHFAVVRPRHCDALTLLPA